MESLNLHIKNMVCPRCIWVVEKELSQMGVNIIHIELGHVSILIPREITAETIEEKLSEFGFELLKSKDEIIIDLVKKGVCKFVKRLEKVRTEEVMSDFLVKEIGKNYNYLSKLFSQHEGHTIENYCIELKINRVKELIDYDEYNLSEIAAMMGYSSVQYLSSQFRKVMGESVSEYKQNLNTRYAKYNSLSEALKELKELGFIYDFQKSNEKIKCKELQMNFDMKELDINEVYRFRETSSRKGRSVIFAVEAMGGIKGIMVESYNEMAFA